MDEVILLFFSSAVPIQSGRCGFVESKCSEIMARVLSTTSLGDLTNIHPTSSPFLLIDVAKKYINKIKKNCLALVFNV